VAQFSAVEEYNPVTDTWIKKTNMSITMAGLSTCAVSGKIYAIGGYSWERPNLEVSAVEEYDPVKDKWSKKANMLNERQFFAACAVGERIYAIGGWRGGQAISAVEEYDPVKDEWTKKADIPATRFGFSAGVVNGKIYVIGGYPIGGDVWPNNGFLSLVEEYDPVTDKWTKKADMPTARMSLSTSVVNGKIYAIGGWVGGNTISVSLVEEYDPVTDKWTKKANMLTAKFMLSTSAVNGKIYAIGGADQAWNALSTVEEYDTGFKDESINFKGKLPTTWGDVRTILNR
jgi:hypothetical protein